MACLVFLGLCRSQNIKDFINKIYYYYYKVAALCTYIFGYEHAIKKYTYIYIYFFFFIIQLEWLLKCGCFAYRFGYKVPDGIYEYKYHLLTAKWSTFFRVCNLNFYKMIPLSFKLCVPCTCPSPDRQTLDPEVPSLRRPTLSTRTFHRTTSVLVGLAGARRSAGSCCCLGCQFCPAEASWWGVRRLMNVQQRQEVVSERRKGKRAEGLDVYSTLWNSPAD